MSEFCSICGLPAAQVGTLDKNGNCAFCATQETLREKRYRKEANDRETLPTKIGEILTGPPTPDELAAAATVCERLAVHIDSQPRRDWTRRADHLRDTVGILRSFLTPVLVVLFMFVGCSNDARDETDTYQFDDPGSELLVGYARGDAAIEVPEGTDAAIEETEKTDIAIEETEKHDAAIEETEKPEETEETDAAIEETEKTDSAIEIPEENDAGTDPHCIYSGTWSVRIVQGTLCVSQNDPFVLVIDDCDQTDFERALDMSDPTFGDFDGSITYHVDFEDQNSFTGTADIVGTISINGQELECSSVATILGGRDETGESS